MSIGIYKFENIINGHIYIGQSTCIERRFQQHLYDARHLEERIKSKAGIDAAINKYGIENFNFSIIEECDAESLDDREIYWISFYDSYNNGYNLTIGGNSLRGENHPRAILTEQQVWDIREEYAKGTQRKIALQPYIDLGIAERTLIKVWHNENWTTVHQDVYTEENKAKHKNQNGPSQFKNVSNEGRKYSKQEVALMKEDYQNGMTINAIAKKYHRDNSTVKKYLVGNCTPGGKINYNGRKVQNIETQIIFESVSAAARWANCGKTTLRTHLATDKIAGTVPETGESAHWIELT